MLITMTVHAHLFTVPPLLHLVLLNFNGRLLTTPPESDGVFSYSMFCFVFFQTDSFSYFGFAPLVALFKSVCVFSMDWSLHGSFRSRTGRTISLVLGRWETSS